MTDEERMEIGRSGPPGRGSGKGRVGGESEAGRTPGSPPGSDEPGRIVSDGAAACPGSDACSLAERQDRSVAATRTRPSQPDEHAAVAASPTGETDGHVVQMSNYRAAPSVGDGICRSVGMCIAIRESISVRPRLLSVTSQLALTTGDAAAMHHCCLRRSSTPASPTAPYNTAPHTPHGAATAHRRALQTGATTAPVHTDTVLLQMARPGDIDSRAWVRIERGCGDLPECEER
ncbi:hypothetical protein TOPH_02437 [Tolypocladium ophioglossoides CBS 100239]|uniref:Uncharacterized protein n=1 Tax=Tolypocladium ophioglossoides (strain CBS 100239) TaxID=1163406 RepID=A0A0L0NHE9_TOLOC|nr:hypothetical protein TOPH_02437 [Tolypocladium ophioglossoides CBS 100239]